MSTDAEQTWSVVNMLLTPDLALVLFLVKVTEDLVNPISRLLPVPPIHLLRAVRVMPKNDIIERATT